MCVEDLVHRDQTNIPIFINMSKLLNRVVMIEI